MATHSFFPGFPQFLDFIGERGLGVAQLFAAARSVITCTLKPNPRPFARPGSVSGTNTDDISSTVLGPSKRLPFSSPRLASIWANCR